MTEQNKLQDDLVFYYWVGVVLYLFHTILNVIDFHLRFEWDPLGYLGFAVYFGVNLIILSKIRKMKNWARNVFIVKFFIFVLVFYPQAVVLKSGCWMYSAHFPHGVFQRMSNFGNFLYELFFTLFLLKKNIRLAFVRA